MGFFKQMKDMKNMVHEAPELIAQSNQLAANAQAQAAAQQAMGQQAMGQAYAPVMPQAAPEADGAAFPMPGAPAAPVAPVAPIAGGAEAINGVTLELFAEISKSFAEVNYDQSKGPELAARKGVAPADWEAAMAGWNARIQADKSVAQRFNALYMGK